MSKIDVDHECFQIRIYSNRFYQIIINASGKKIEISNIFQGKDYAKNIPDLLDCTDIDCAEIQRIRCIAGTHEPQVNEMKKREKIKIISTPPGSEPERIRKQWVGIIIPTIGIKGKHTRTDIENLGGFIVSPMEAIKALIKEKRDEAVIFWTPYCNRQSLVFKKEVCEKITEYFK